MKFYELSREERTKLRTGIINEVKRRQGFLKYAANEDVYIRKIAARTIGKVKNLGFLNSHMNDDNEFVRQTIGYALLWIGKKNPVQVISNLKELASDGSKHVRSACIEALRGIGKSSPGRMVNLLKPWLKSDNPNIRACAVNGVELVGRDVDPDIAFKLLRLVRNDADVQCELIRVLVQASYKYGPKKTFIELRKWKVNASDSVLKIINEAVSEILSIHKDKPRLCIKSYREVLELSKKYKLTT